MGETLTARVVAVLGNRITLNLGWAKLDAQTEVPLQEGQWLKLLVKEASVEKLVFQALGEDKLLSPEVSEPRAKGASLSLPVVVDGQIAWVRMEIGRKPSEREQEGSAEDGKSRGSGSSAPVALDLEWETEASGPVRAHLQVQGRRLTGGIYFKDRGAAGVAEEMLPGLEEALRRESFAVEGLRCALKSDLSAGRSSSPGGTRNGALRIDLRL